MTDVVYILGNGSKWQDNELRYSLRSLERFVRFRKVFIIGERPEFLNGEAIHVSWPDQFGDKARNIATKLKVACFDSRLSDSFLFLNDDYFFTQEIDPCNYPYFYSGDLRETLKTAKSQHYAKHLKTTIKHLTGESLPTKDFDVHFPIVYEKSKLIRVIDGYEWGKRLPEFQRAYGPVLKSLYCNTLNIEGLKREDCKARNRMTPQQWLDFIKNKEMFSVGENIDDTLKQFLGELYPGKSRFEKS